VSKNFIKILICFSVGIAGGIFGSQIVWPYVIENVMLKVQQPVYVTQKTEVTVQENTALTDAINRVSKSTVGIRTTTVLGETIEGSGLVLTSDGLIVSLAELVPQGSDFRFYIDGKAMSYQILKRDLDENLVLIKIEASNLSTVGFADYEKILLGQRVFLSGLIFPEETSTQSVANEGIITSFNDDSLNINIKESPDRQGSPLFDISGSLLGLCEVDEQGNISVIPVSKIKTFTGI
jgi:hypothetical protein